MIKNFEETFKKLIGQTVDKEDKGMCIETLLYETCNIVNEQGADGWQGKRTYDAIYELYDENYGYRFLLNGLNYFIYVDEEGLVTGVE